ncbi:MAG: hypothetical protein Q4A58_05475 [Fusobacterium sp.]|uniref:hypothetical protein n=1 Tax=Fusobacterium sp. TaxID=68766 RepID=UPI0026DB240A|nr:hypothetical protein [Fusobacterium sp.]MDO4690730.1 hypothetical protein [Fusobacterium sp.]
MKKILITLFFVISSLTFSDDLGLGIINASDLKAVGVKEENIKKAKELMNEVASSYRLKTLEIEQLQLQINKYVLEGPEKYLNEIDQIFDKIGSIEAAISKERIRSQIKIQKLITQEQYVKAREIAVKRLNGIK